MLRREIKILLDLSGNLRGKRAGKIRTYKNQKIHLKNNRPHQLAKEHSKSG
jgi:hypothetical protein